MKTHFDVRIALSCLVLILLSGVASAQNPARASISKNQRVPRSFSSSATFLVNRAQVLVLESVREELKLSQQQRDDIDKLLVDWSRRETENVGSRASKTAEEQRAIFGDSRQDAQATWEKIQALLTPEQLKRFDQLALQRKGFRIFVVVPREVSSQLDIDPAQRAKWRDIYLEWENRYGRLPVRNTEGWETLMGRFLAVLTDEQQTQWKELTGEPFGFREPRGGGRRPRMISISFPNLGIEARWLEMDWVHAELKLNDTQRKTITEALDRWKQRYAEVQATVRDGQIPDREAKIRESIASLHQLSIETTDQLLAALKPEQKQRLEQLKLQREGLRALLQPSKAFESLRLSYDQRRKINASHNEFYRAANDQGRFFLNAEERKQFEAKVLEFFTDKQRMAWEALLGEPFDFPDDPFGLKSKTGGDSNNSRDE